MIKTYLKRAGSLTLAFLIALSAFASFGSKTKALNFTPTANPSGSFQTVIGTQTANQIMTKKDVRTPINYYGGMISVPDKVKTYPYYVDPKEYPDFNKRPYHTMNWDDYSNIVQLVCGRTFPSADLDARRTVKGTVWRGYVYNATGASAATGLQYIKDKGYIVHNLSGYLPGEASNQYFISQRVYDLMNKYVPTKFTGFDIGEHDQRLNFSTSSVINPFTDSKKINFLKNREYMKKIGEDQGDWGSVLSCLWYWQYAAKDNQAYALGAENQNKVTNPQIHYSNLRGAGKQYGILWYGDLAFTDAIGYKSYAKDPNNPSKFIDNGVGGSPAYIKRVYYSQYTNNSTILCLESGWTLGWASPVGDLTPVGYMHNAAYDLVQENPRPGVMHTPFAMMNDFYSGWMPARQQANKFQTWNTISYNEGDYLTDAIYSMYLPKYEDCAYFQNEQGAVTDTPYGDSMDTLLTDSRVEVMKQYPIIYAASDMFSADVELKSKVEAYVKNGGYYVVTAENAKKLWPAWYSNASKKTFANNSVINWANGSQNLKETNDFEIYTDVNFPDNCVVKAKTQENDIVVAEIPMGSGKVILINSPYGMNKTRLAYSDNAVTTANWEMVYPDDDTNRDGWSDSKSLGRPYELSDFSRIVYDELAKSQQLFTVTDSKDNSAFSGKLNYTVNVQGNNEYLVTVANNSTQTKYFNINSQIGNIISKTELSTFRPGMTKEEWYGSPTYFSYNTNTLGESVKPTVIKMQSSVGNNYVEHENVPLDVNGNKYPDVASRVADASSNDKIFAGDIRLFKIKVNSNQNAVRQVEQLQKIAIPTQSTNKLLAVKDIGTLEEQITLNPTFYEKFDGVKVDWKEIRNYDKAQLVADRPWYKRHSIKMVVDFTSGFESGELTLNYSEDMRSQYYKTISAITNVLDKMTVIDGAKDIVISSDKSAAQSVENKAIEDIAKQAKIIGAKVEYADSSNQKAIDTVKQLNLENLYVKLNAKGNYAADISAAGAKLGAIYAQPTDGSIDYSAFVNANAYQVLDKLYSADITLKNVTEQPYGIDTNMLNSIFADYTAIWTNKSTTLQKSTVLMNGDTDQIVNPANIYNAVTLRGIGDLRQAINNIPDFFQYYGAVSVDYRYLLKRDIRQIEEDQKWLAAKKIRVITDFTEDVNNYPGLTLSYTVIEDYERTIDTFADVITKMRAIGSRELVMTTHGGNYNTLSKSIGSICETALKYGITVNISTAKNKLNSGYDDSAFLAKFAADVGYENIKIAINTDFLPKNFDLNKERVNCGKYLNMIIYGNARYDSRLAGVDLFANSTTNLTSLQDKIAYKTISDGYTFSSNYLFTNGLAAKAMFAPLDENKIPPVTSIDFGKMDLTTWNYYEFVDLNKTMENLKNGIFIEKKEEDNSWAVWEDTSTDNTDSDNSQQGEDGGETIENTETNQNSSSTPGNIIKKKKKIITEQIVSGSSTILMIVLICAGSLLFLIAFIIASYFIYRRLKPTAPIPKFYRVLKAPFLMVKKLFSRKSKAEGNDFHE